MACDNVARTPAARQWYEHVNRRSHAVELGLEETSQCTVVRGTTFQGPDACRVDAQALEIARDSLKLVDERRPRQTGAMPELFRRIGAQIDSHGTILKPAGGVRRVLYIVSLATLMQN